MDAKKSLIDVLNGKVPEKTPLSFYSWMVGDTRSEDISELFSPPWQKLYDMGLVICHHTRVVNHIQHNVEDKFEESTQGKNHIKIHKKVTPVGTIQQVIKDGWLVEHFLKETKDYKVMTWIADNTELVPCYEQFNKGEELVGDKGIVVVFASRTPAMSINVDLAGTEQFCIDVALKIDELYELYDALKKLFIQETELIAKGPGRFVKWLENLAIEFLGPNRYEELLIPIYEQCTPVLEKADKRVMVHYDGPLTAITKQIADAPFHIIESLTEPPEGDMTYDKCRENWPDKVFWANINLDDYYLPQEEFRQVVIDKRKRAGKKGLAFEISEDLPNNWQESIPTVLNALNDLD